MNKPDMKYPVKWFANRQCWMIGVGDINQSSVLKPDCSHWELREDVSQWFVANGLEGRSTGPDWTWGEVAYRRDLITFHFRDKVKATLFKLTWA